MNKTDIVRIFDNAKKDILQHLDINLNKINLKVSAIPEDNNGNERPEMKDKSAGSYVKSKGYIILNPDIDKLMRYFGMTNISSEEFLYMIAIHELCHAITDDSNNKELFQRIIIMATSRNFSTKYLDKENFQSVSQSKYHTELFAEFISYIFYKIRYEPFYYYHLAPKDVDVYKEGIITPGYAYKNNDIETFRKMTDKYRERICYEWKIFPNKLPKELTDDEIIYAINKFRKSENGIFRLYLLRHIPTKDLGPNMKKLLQENQIIRIDLHDKLLREQVSSIQFNHDDNYNYLNEKVDKLYYYIVTKEEYYTMYNDQEKNMFNDVNHISIVLKNGKLENAFTIVS